MLHLRRLVLALLAVGVFTHLKQLHHAAIFVGQYMTVLHIQTGEISEATAHYEVAWRGGKAVRPQDHFAFIRAVRILLGGGDSEIIPPDTRPHDILLVVPPLLPRGGEVSLI